MTNEELYYLPTSELLKHIQAEKERLIKEKVIKKPKPLSIITDEEKLYELPEEWGWIRLGNIIHFTSEKKIDGDCLPLLDVKFFRNNKNTVLASKGTVVDKGDLLILKDGENSGEVFKTTQKGYMGSTLKKFTIAQVVNEDYILYFIRSNFAVLKGNKTGSAIPHLDFNLLNNLLLPLPPQYIQDQIVQKLDKISETKDSLLSHAESQLNYTKKMREALLQEAIRGELVPQDENDEPASVLLEKIKSEKERLIKEKVIKKQNELPPITDEEKPYDLPEGWEWVRLGEAIQFIGGQQPPKSTFKSELEDGYIRLIQIRDYKTDSFKTYAPIDKCRKFCTDTDVMIGRYGPPIFQILRGLEGAYNVALMKADPYRGGFDLEYVFYLLKQPLLLWELERYSQRTAGQDGIDMDVLKNYVVGLPPLEEQKRIVAKLDELMANCDRLEAKAEEMKTYTTKLFEASFKEAFMPK